MDERVAAVPEHSERKRELLDAHGELIGGSELHRHLGYVNLRALSRAYQRGLLPVRVFMLPDRRGLYAQTRDLADWLDSL